MNIAKILKQASDKLTPEQKARHEQFNERLATLDPWPLIERARNGLAIPDFEAIQQASPFTELQWATILDMTPRTLQRHKQKGEALDTARSERVLLIEQLLRHAEMFAGGFGSWMNSPAFAFGGVRPVELLDTVTGIKLVSDELGRIEYGVYT